MFQIRIRNNRLVGKDKAISDEYLSYVNDLLASPVVQKMDTFTQHGTTTTLDHCLNVSFYNFLACKMLGLNARAGARGGLLHDLFLYDWHERPVGKGGLTHSIFHPRVALENAKKHFELTKLEQEIILKHMFPYTLDGMPKSKEAFVISLIDKYCCLMETVDSRAGGYVKSFYGTVADIKERISA
ncbi:MAG: HD domain-containing protein [Oscillospiraceae bacterium]|nr:HD domain-containing protein [Oscillospiraceae bacterium]